jgi:hypothetical protein
MGFIKSTVDSFTGKAGADAAQEAGRISKEAAKKAAKAGIKYATNASNITQDYGNQALGQINQAYDIYGQSIPQINQAYDPFIQQGQQLVSTYQPMVEQGATAAGMGQRLGEIYNTSAFQPLIDERQQAAATQLANTGLSRSGAALRAAAAVPTELGFDIENQLYGRQNQLYSGGLNLGYNASTGRASALNDVYGNQAQNRTQAGVFNYGLGRDLAGYQTQMGQIKMGQHTQQGDAMANAALGEAASLGQGASNLTNLASTGLGFYGASQGWFK